MVLEQTLQHLCYTGIWGSLKETFPALTFLSCIYWTGAVCNSALLQKGSGWTAAFLPVKAFIYTHTHAHTHTQSVCKKSNYWPAACKCIPHTARPPLCGQSLPWMLPVQALLGRDIYIYNFILTCIWICFIFRSILKVRLLGIICQLTSNWEQPREKKKKKKRLSSLHKVENNPIFEDYSPVSSKVLCFFFCLEWVNKSFTHILLCGKTKEKVLQTEHWEIINTQNTHKCWKIMKTI